MRDVETVAAEEQAEAVANPPVPDLSGQPVTREGDTLTIGSGEPTHEIDITVSDEEYETIQQAIPEEKVYDPAVPVYHEGDTVYLEIWNTRLRSYGRIPYSFFPPAWLTPFSGPRAGNGLSSFYKTTCETAPLPSFFLLTRRKRTRTCGKC